MRYRRFILQALHFLKECVQSLNSHPPQTKYQQTLVWFFTEHNLRSTTELLVVKYFPLSQEDLSKWEDAPEEFYLESLEDCWDSSLRAAGENLFVALACQYREVLGQLRINKIKCVSKLQMELITTFF